METDWLSGAKGSGESKMKPRLKAWQLRDIPIEMVSVQEGLGGKTSHMNSAMIGHAQAVRNGVLDGRGEFWSAEVS